MVKVAHHERYIDLLREVKDDVCPECADHYVRAHDNDQDDTEQEQLLVLLIGDDLIHQYLVEHGRHDTEYGDQDRHDDGHDEEALVGLHHPGECSEERPLLLPGPYEFFLRDHHYESAVEVLIELIQCFLDDFTRVRIHVEDSLPLYAVNRNIVGGSVLTHQSGDGREREVVVGKRIRTDVDGPGIKSKGLQSFIESIDRGSVSIGTHDVPQLGDCDVFAVV